MAPPDYLTSLRYWTAFSLTAAAYAVSAIVGLQWSVIPGAGSAVWPAAGVAIAALVLGGLRLWPAIVIGRLITAAVVVSQQPWWNDLLVALGTTAGAVIPVYLANRDGGISPDIGRMRDMVWLTIGGAAGGAVISASLGVLALLIGGVPAAKVPNVWLNWASGYLVGALTLAPLILAWSEPSWRTWRVRQWLHVALCLMAVAGTAYVTFFSPKGSYVPAWYVYPALVWAALAFQVRGAAAAIAVAAVMALASAVQGVGILTTLAPDILGRVFFSQQFVAVSAFTILFLAAAADERRGSARLRESQATTRLALQAGRLTSWRWDLRSGLFTAEGSSDDLFGYVPGSPLPARELLDRIHPDDRTRIEALTNGAVRERRTFDFEYRLTFADGRVEWLSSSVRPVFDAGGRLTHFIGVSQAITERKRAEEHRLLLINELNHRVKNTLAIVQGIAQQSFKSEAVPPELREAFEGRLSALGAAHNVLTRESWESAPLRQITEDAARPFGLTRFSIGGPEIRIAPKPAVSLALTLHELATNAAKYGALSVEGGRVLLHWSVENGLFNLEWREEGGPPVAAPTRRGFGSRLIERGLAGEIGGQTGVDYAADGLRWRVCAPLDRLTA